jgi:hypothetical protein
MTASGTGFSNSANAVRDSRAGRTYDENAILSLREWPLQAVGMPHALPQHRREWPRTREPATTGAASRYTRRQLQFRGTIRATISCQ